MELPRKPSQLKERLGLPLLLLLLIHIGLFLFQFHLLKIKNKKPSPTGNRTQTKRVKTAHPNHWTIGDFGYIGNWLFWTYQVDAGKTMPKKIALSGKKDGPFGQKR